MFASTMTTRFILLVSFFLAAFMAPVLGAPIEADVAVRADASELDKRVSHWGDGTYFYPGLGACGWTNKGSDLIVAIAGVRWNKGGNCGQYVSIVDTKNGKQAFAKVVDECPECSDGSLDMSPSLFTRFAAESVGRIPIKWNFMPKGWKP